MFQDAKKVGFIKDFSVFYLFCLSIDVVKICIFKLHFWTNSYPPYADLVSRYLFYDLVGALALTVVFRYAIRAKQSFALYCILSTLLSAFMTWVYIHNLSHYPARTFLGQKATIDGSITAFGALYAIANYYSITALASIGWLLNRLLKNN